MAEQERRRWPPASSAACGSPSATVSMPVPGFARRSLLPCDPGHRRGCGACGCGRDLRRSYARGSDGGAGGHDGFTWFGLPC